MPPAKELVKGLSAMEAKDWRIWDVLFVREEAVYVLWPFGKQRNFMKVKCGDARLCQNGSIVGKAMFEGRELPLNDIDRIMQLLIPVNGTFAQKMVNDICPICYAIPSP